MRSLDWQFDSTYCCVCVTRFPCRTSVPPHCVILLLHWERKADSQSSHSALGWWSFIHLMFIHQHHFQTRFSMLFHTSASKNLHSCYPTYLLPCSMSYHIDSPRLILTTKLQQWKTTVHWHDTCIYCTVKQGKLDAKFCRQIVSLELKNRTEEATLVSAETSSRKVQLPLFQLFPGRLGLFRNKTRGF